MKRYVKLILLICSLTLGISPILAANPEFLILDQNKAQFMVMADDFKPMNTFETGSSPSALIPLANQSGYLLLCNGSKNIFGHINHSGNLLYLDNQFNPTTKKYLLPGLVIQNFYFKDNATWIFITQNEKDTTAPASVIIYDIQTGQEHLFHLKSLPTAYRFNKERAIFALTTLGVPAKKEPAQLVTINLTELSMKSFPVASNPGEIYFTDENNILVACGGFRKGFIYSTKTPLESFETSKNASLHWIDTLTGTQKITNLGYSPLVIIQDQLESNTFYAAYSDTIYEKEVKGSFHKIVAGEIVSDVKFTAEPEEIIRVKSGNICLIGREEFYIINPAGTEIITEKRYALKIDELILNSDQTTGYLSVVNSGNLDVFDLVTGQAVKKLKIRPSLNIPINLADLFASDLPPVAGLGIPNDDLPTESLDRKQVILNEDHKSLVVLANQYEVRNIDIETGKTITTIKIPQGKPNGIYRTVNHKYYIVPTNSNCLLIDPLKSKPILNIQFIQSDPNGFPPEHIYSSPDGNIVVIPHNGTFYIIDSQNGKLVNKLYNKVQKAKVTWIKSY